jgi:hypothetical protein
VSITTHGGIIHGFLHVMGRPIYQLPTGGPYDVLFSKGYYYNLRLTGVSPVVIKAVNAV